MTTHDRHIFQPLVSVTKRDDDRYDVEFDWAESYQYAVNDGVENPHEEPLAEEDNIQEARAAQKALESYTGKHPERFIISAGLFGSVEVTDDDDERDVRADRIEEGWIVRDYGNDEWRKVASRDDHGDTVLVTFDNGDETTFDTDESIARKVT